MSEEINQEILAELRKLKRIFKVILIFVVVGALPAFYTGLTRSSADSWERVRTAMSRQDFPAALSMAKTLEASQPNYYYGHTYLGLIYLAMGDDTNAEVEYSRAYDLFPSEDNAKDLQAVRKRLSAELLSK